MVTEQQIMEYFDKKYDRSIPHRLIKFREEVKPFPQKMNQYQQQKRKKSFRRRAAIEPIIGHAKSEHRLSPNYYKGELGDAINVMLAAVGFNFKRMMNRYKKIIADMVTQTLTRVLGSIST